ALCQATNTMTYEPESSIGFGFSTDVVISRAGTWTPTCGNFPCVNPCTGVASKVIASVSQLPTLNGSVVPFRFGTPVINGVNFVFDAPTTATPPP
ncbi:MAG TPA: hypothetical protein VKU41_13205, partial [Polyangiaceae bacterium]|nr:hypothetical protein [Polyangiaceae bacterium]